MSGIHSWPSVPLSEAFWFQEGPGVRKWQFTKVGVKLLNVGNIEKDGSLNLSKTDRHLDEVEVEKKYSHFLVDAGDLVIASSGISFDEDGLLRTRGVFVKQTDLPLCLNTSTIRFKPVEGVSDLRFLRLWLNSRDFRAQITRLVTGTAQQNFGPSHLKATKIRLPSLEEQRRIAAILDKADELRAKRRAALAQLNQFALSVFEKVFGDPSENPKHWPVRLVSDYVVRFQGGKSIDSEAGESVTTRNRVLKISAVTGMHFLSEESKPVPDSYTPPKEHFVSRGDLLFSRANTTELVGAVAYVHHAPKNLLLPDKLWRFVWRQPDCIEPRFFWFLFQTPALRREIGRRATGTSGSMKNISQEKLMNISTIFPPISIQRDFVRKLSAIEKMKGLHSTSLKQMDALFASLQYRAFRGEL
ncbi:MAG: restriction endonuclease subunit S [Candidatus Angelobacter sp.]